MIYYEIKAETPSKKNSRVFNAKTHKSFPSKKYKEWHEFAALSLRPKIRECITSKGYIILVFNHGDLIRRDSDNGVSSIFDALVDFKALEDDNWQIVRQHCVFNVYEKNNPWCKIYIFKPEEKELYKQYVIECIDKYE